MRVSPVRAQETGHAAHDPPISSGKFSTCRWPGYPYELMRESPGGVYGYTELSTVEGIGGVLLKSYPESQLIEYVTRARVS